MTWWEESNPWSLLCRCLLLRSVCFNCVPIACPGVLLFPSTCWRCYMLGSVVGRRNLWCQGADANLVVYSCPLSSLCYSISYCFVYQCWSVLVYSCEGC